MSNLTEGGDGATITRSIIALGQALGLEVIAEGIETEEQAEILRAMGCLFGQGYLFSRPLTPTAVQELLDGGMRYVPKKVTLGNAKLFLTKAA